MTWHDLDDSALACTLAERGVSDRVVNLLVHQRDDPSITARLDHFLDTPET